VSGPGHIRIVRDAGRDAVPSGVTRDGRAAPLGVRERSDGALWPQRIVRSDVYPPFEQGIEIGLRAARVADGYPRSSLRQYRKSGPRNIMDASEFSRRGGIVRARALFGARLLHEWTDAPVA
jgi:hypothetical protein